MDGHVEWTDRGSFGSSSLSERRPELVRWTPDETGGWPALASYGKAMYRRCVQGIREDASDVWVGRSRCGEIRASVSCHACPGPLAYYGCLSAEEERCGAVTLLGSNCAEQAESSQVKSSHHHHGVHSGGNRGIIATANHHHQRLPRHREPGYRSSKSLSLSTVQFHPSVSAEVRREGKYG